jgi:hypothetical protein
MAKWIPRFSEFLRELVHHAVYGVVLSALSFAVTFVWTAAKGIDALFVWILSAVAAGSVSLVYIALRVAFDKKLAPAGTNAKPLSLAEQALRQWAKLQVTGPFPFVDANKTYWRVAVENIGLAEARNLTVRLLGIAPPPRDQNWAADYPYDVPRVSLRHLWPGALKFDLNPGQEEAYEPFRSWLSSDGKLMIVGLDAREPTRLNDFAASISPGEDWRLSYECRAANAEPMTFYLRLYVKAGKVACERGDP